MTFRETNSEAISTSKFEFLKSKMVDGHYLKNVKNLNLFNG